MANLGYIQVTRDCNQRCRFCSNPPSGREATGAELQAQVDDLVRRGCTGVILTGGEPTLHLDLPDLVAYTRDQGVTPRIITNAQRLAEGPLLDQLLDAGLRHLHVSLYTHRATLQDHLTQTPGSGARVRAALARLGRRRETRPDLTVDLNVVISRANADHLHRVVDWALVHAPFVGHWVFNNLDPSTDRIAEAPDLVPRLRDFEVSLQRALRTLQAAGRTFRVERVPLCYLAGFEHVSTETRKIVKEEPRLVHFLDDKRLVCQQGRAGWQRGKAEACQHCRLDPLCAGLDSMGHHYDPAELAPVFADPRPIAQRIQGQR